MQTGYTIFPISDSAFTIDFGNKIDDGINKKVLGLFEKLRPVSPFIKDIIPAYSSLTVYYDPWSFHSLEKSAYDTVIALVKPYLEQEVQIPVNRRKIEIPVCYSDKFGPDLEEMANQKNLSKDEIIGYHTAIRYRVYMIGFLPGFAYMGTVDERIAAPRKQKPRITVDAGSVGIAGHQTGIYPLASPGGWNIIGRTPLKMFDASRETATVLEPGDEVKFYSISEDEFENYKGGDT